MSSLWASAKAATEKARAEATKLAVSVEAAATSAADTAISEATRIAVNVEEAASSASNSVSHNVNNLVNDGYGFKPTVCALCGGESDNGASAIAYNISTGKIHSFQRCIVCNKRHCPKCIKWSKYRIPTTMHHLHTRIRDETKSVNSSNVCRFNTVTGAPKPTHSAETRAALEAATVPEEDWLCVTCEADTLLPLWNVDFETSKGSAFHGNIMAFLESELDNTESVRINYVFFPKPTGEGGTEAERTKHYRKRQLQVVDVTLRTLCLVPVTGAFGMALGAFQGSVAVMGIIDSEVADFLTHVYEALDGMGLTAAPPPDVKVNPVKAKVVVTAASASATSAAAGGTSTATVTVSSETEATDRTETEEGPGKKSIKDSAIEVLRLYYYGCDVLRRKKNERDFNMKGHAAGDAGILHDCCPQELFEYIGQFVAPAQWLYNSLLPVPHDGNEWSGWYLSQILRHEQSGGWTLLMCSNETSVLPSGVLCPGFALAVRNHPPEIARSCGSRGEVLLTIRGSTTSKDWFINVNEKAVPFEYLQGGYSSYTGGDADVDLVGIASRTEPNSRAPFRRVQCQVHSGMLNAALGILEDYHVVEYLSQLREVGGYTDVKVVGHSLGAGVAALIVAVLKNSVVAAWEKVASPAAAAVVQKRLVCGIGFATPACVCAELADAMLLDNVFTSVINKDDIVPRLNKRNMRNLADTIASADQVERANRWGAVDYGDARNWVTTIGKAKLIRDQSGSGDESRTGSGDVAENPELFGSSVSFVPGSATAPVQPTTDFANPASAPPLPEDLPEGAELLASVSFVVPGKVIHLVETEQGGTAVTLGTHRMDCLHEIFPILESVHQHTMRVYTVAMRSAKLATPPSATTLCSGTDRGERQLLQSDPMRSSISGASAGASVNYNRCGVCRVDGAWPLVLQSNATRSLTMQNCAVCGLLVCVFCAPTGNKIQGDGYSATVELPDYRIVVPRLNHLEPQTTCRCCFINSYNL